MRKNTNRGVTTTAGKGGRVARQRRSITDIICENCKYLPTKRSRNKRKPIPKESDVKTFNYTAHLWDIRWLRERARKTR
ncbi:TPA: NinE family protein [Escherichia coli]|nr:NinE family protein [Escherichia coli]